MATVLHIVQMFGQRTADPRVEQQHRTSQTRLVKIVYSAWKEVTRRGLPRRRKVQHSTVPMSSLHILRAHIFIIHNLPSFQNKIV